MRVASDRPSPVISSKVDIRLGESLRGQRLPRLGVFFLSPLLRPSTLPFGLFPDDLTVYLALLGARLLHDKTGPKHILRLLNAELKQLLIGQRGALRAGL